MTLYCIDCCLQDRLVDEGYNPSYGARPLRRAIMRLLEDSMAERMLSGDIKEGDSVIIDVDADGQVWNPCMRMTPIVLLALLGSLAPSSCFSVRVSSCWWAGAIAAGT